MLARPRITSAQQAHASGKPVVFLLGNIHPPEPEAAEALMMLARDLAVGKRGDLLDNQIVMIAPIFNVDGTDTFVTQDGSLGSETPYIQGTRENSQGLDLNRDAVKLRTVEAKGLYRVLNDWAPVLLLDGHLMSRVSHGYANTYGTTTVPAAAPGPRDYTHDTLFPAVRDVVRRDFGLEVFTHALSDRQWPPTVWSHDRAAWTVEAKFIVNDYGLRNRLAIITETPGHPTFERRIYAQYAYLSALLNHTNAHAKNIQAVVKAADDETVAQVLAGAESGELENWLDGEYRSRGKIDLLARNRVAPGTLYSYAGALRGRAAISINGRNVSAAPDAQGYVSLDREWRSGDRIELEFPFEVRKVIAEDRVRETRGRVAIERGPIVYCVEGPDVEDGHALDVRLDPPSLLRSSVEERPATITATAKSVSNPSAASRAISLIPYYTWANRGRAEMSVWIPTREYVPGDIGPAGGLIFFVNPNYAVDGWRYLEAAPFDQSLGAKWGCFRREIKGARGTAIGTGRQNTQDMLAACAERGTAADLCATYVLSGIGGWFLPSLDGLTTMYKNLLAAGAADFRDQGMADNCQYWTSSQQTADMANHIDFADGGRVHYDDKDFPRCVRAIRAF